MKIRWRYGIAFPLVLAVSLGALAAWLGRISEVQVEEVVLNPNEPQYSMKGINGKRFDQEGRLKENLSAADAVQYPNSADVHLDKPHLSFYRDGSLLYEVGSDKAVYNIQNKKVVFEQNVVLNKTADAKRLAGIVKTERLNVDTEAQYAHTDSPVTFQYGQSGGQANGMTYDHKTGLLNFPSKVKAIIYDTKNL